MRILLQEMSSNNNMKNIVLFLAVIISGNSYSQNFYDLNTIQKIEITFSQSNWDQLMDDEKATTEYYIMAQSIAINGQTFDSVGVKYKGNSTYKDNQVKNPLHIELDTYKDQNYQGYTDIKLSNVYNDPSFLREVLSYQILRKYMDAPLANYANVYINGNLIGLYSNAESITKKFVNGRFGSKSNTFFKCNPPAGAGPGTNDYPNLAYLGNDSSDYYAAYEIKSNSGWSDLIELCDTLENNFNNIENILDVDRAIWMLAFNNVLVNLDSYTGAFTQNYYLYKDDNKRFVPVVWDLNESFGRFSMTGTINLQNTAAKQQMSHLLHENDTDFPLIKQLLGNPMYKRMYLAHFKTILKENFSNNEFFTNGQAIQTLIDTDVQADVNKFYTYNNFVDNLTNDISTSGGGPPGANTTPGIANLMNGRNTYLAALSDFTKTEPNISNVTISDSIPDIHDSVFISAKVTDANSVYISYRAKQTLPFVKIEMFDDGLHGDGQANDQVFGAQIILNSTSTQYYIYADNNNIGKFSPLRAEHEFYSINTVSELLINEIQASNQITIADPFGKYEDWIEIYNPNETAISLSNYYLTDDDTDPYQYQFPNLSIPSKSHKIVWASGDSTTSENHANFKISKSGESISLFKKKDGLAVEIDFIQFGTQQIDYSLGRESDGAENWVEFPYPTPNAENIFKPLNIEKISFNNFSIYPNPYNNQLNFINQKDEKVNITIYSISGKILFSAELSPNENFTWRDEFSSGMRIIHLQSISNHQVIKVISH